MSKAKYIRPEVFEFALDNTTSLLMMSPVPGNNDPSKRSAPVGESPSQSSDPFASPFQDSPFK
jgi:hypothetical protein